MDNDSKLYSHRHNRMVWEVAKYDTNLYYMKNMNSHNDCFNKIIFQK